MPFNGCGSSDARQAASRSACLSTPLSSTPENLTLHVTWPNRNRNLTVLSWPEDWRRIAELAARFADHDDIDLVDFAIVRLSEKFRAEKIATVNRPHFTVLRRFHNERFPLILPE